MPISKFGFSRRPESTPILTSAPYGRKQSRPLQLVCGVGLMAYPYFVESLVWMAIIAVLIVAGLWGALKLGL